MATHHQHTWRTASRHRTGDGVVSYQRCRCGIWRVLLGAADVVAQAGPAAITRRTP